jgi:hypothetical protein
MSSLADLPELVGFFSYSREDDADSFGALSALRTRIQGELRGQLGRTAKTFRLWQDKEAIASGTLWETEIKNAVGQSAFFIPIITPTVVASPHCRFELDSFLAREAELGRTDLVFPILYIEIPALEDSDRRQNDPVLSLIAKRQYANWGEFRYLDVNSTEVKREVGRYCSHIRDALYRSWISPAERARQEETATFERVEAERKRREAETEKRSDEEARQKAMEEQSRKREVEAQRAAEERRQQEAEAKHRAAENEARGKQKAENSQSAEAARRAGETVARRRVEEERAFAAAKADNSVRMLDAFLNAYPDGKMADEVRILRERLVKRDAAHKMAMTGNDKTVLQAFLDEYPAERLALQVRNRLRRLEEEISARRTAARTTNDKTVLQAFLDEYPAVKLADGGPEGRAFAAAKADNSVRMLDAFLNAYPDGKMADEARILRERLVKRDAAHKMAMTSNDKMVLEAFLDEYPAERLALQVRDRLRRL